MSDIITTLHPKGTPTDNLYPNIKSDNIPNGAVTSVKIQDSAVTTNKINNGAVTSAKIDSKAVTESKIDDNAVTTDKINNGAITNSKLDVDSVSRTKIVDGSIDSNKLEDNCVTKYKMGFNQFQISMRVQFYDSGYDDTIDFELNYLITISSEDDISDYLPNDINDLKSHLAINRLFNTNPLDNYFKYAYWDGTNLNVSYLDSNNTYQYVADTQTDVYIDRVRYYKYF